MSGANRGQTLVVFALTMLSMVVMVCITLAIGMKAREKIELQTMADAAAYSNAVATARTFNAVSVLTRAQISHMVVLAGEQSHISYAGWYWGALNQLRTSVSDGIANGCGGSAECCAAASAALVEIDRQLTTIGAVFTPLDREAGRRARDRQGAAANYGVIQEAMYERYFLQTFMQNHGFAQQIIDTAVPDQGRRAEYLISNAGRDISMREVGGPGYAAARSGSAQTGAYDSDSDPDLAKKAAHGSRASAFIRTRGGFVPTGLVTIGALTGTPTGSAYFGEDMGDLQYETDPVVLWGQDMGSIVGMVACLPIATAAVQTWVKSTDAANVGGLDEHQLGGGAAPAGHEDIDHTMGSCRECPSVWVARVEFNRTGAEDQWGQPKQYVVLDRDYSRRSGPPDPWNLFFRFRFTNTGNGQTVDIGKRLGGAEFTHQAAIATSITYYHRHGAGGQNWQEPPNFFNPFWRATLVPADIDEQGESDMNVAASPLGPAGGAALDALRAAGFRGWQ